MSAIHRVDDIWSMNGPRFFKWAWRLPYYQGVMRERKLREQQEHEEASPAPQQQYAPDDYAATNSRRPKPATRVAIEHDPVLSQIIGYA